LLFGAIFSLLLSILFPEFFLGFVISLMLYAGGSAMASGPYQRFAIDSCQKSMGARMAVFSTLISLGGVVVAV